LEIDDSDISRIKMLIESPELHPEPEKPNEVSEPLDIEDEIKK